LNIVLFSILWKTPQAKEENRLKEIWSLIKYFYTQEFGTVTAQKYRQSRTKDLTNGGFSYETFCSKSKSCEVNMGESINIFVREWQEVDSNTIFDKVYQQNLKKTSTNLQNMHFFG